MARLFRDDFASGDLSHTGGGCAWIPGDVGETNGDVAVVAGIGRNESIGCRFRFTGNASGSDSQAELPFSMPSLSEVWIRYWFKAPSNFQHRAESPGNNKFMQLNGAKNMLTVEYERADDDHSDLKRFLSESEFCDGSDNWPFETTGVADFIGPGCAIPLDTWVHVTIYYRAATACETVNGRFEVLVDGVLVNGLDWAAWDNEDAGAVDGGYLMGWANSGFAADTDFVIDEVEIWDSEPDVALTLGASAGFVTTAPTTDPAGGLASAIDGAAVGVRDTAPDAAVRITEVGWWCDSASEEANYEVALYTDAGNSEPEARLFVSTVNAKGTGAGWKRVTGLNWTIAAGTTYWVAVQVDATTTDTDIDLTLNAGVAGFASLSGVSTLPSDWGTSGFTDDDGIAAIYAVWAPGGNYYYAQQ